MEKRTTTLFRKTPGPADPDARTEVSPAGSDLSALLRRASLSNSSYQEFPTQLRVIRAPFTIEEAAINNRPSVPTQVNGPVRDANKDKLTSASSEKPPSLENSPAQPREQVTDRRRVSERETPWPALDNLFSKPTSVLDLIEGLTTSIRVPTIFVTSTMGGVGATTIAATLGHGLAKVGDRVAIAESEASLVLPFYFGTRGGQEGPLLQFDVPGCPHVIQVVKGIEQFTSQSSSKRLSPNDRENELLARVREAAKISTRFVFDASRLCLEDLLAAAKPFQKTLVAIVPDFGCTLAVLGLEERLNEKLADSQQTDRPLYVFNKFDHELALHRDIEALLKSHLGNRLLPVILRRSDSLSEALAKGMTVLDYCPNAGISHDFQQLAEWVRRANENYESETGQA